MEHIKDVGHVREDEECWWLFERNFPNPNTKVDHRIQAMVVKRGDGFVRYSEDLGPSIQFKAGIFSFMTEDSVGYVREWANNERMFPTGYTHFVESDPIEDLLKKWDNDIFIKSQIKKHGRGYKKYGYGSN